MASLAKNLPVAQWLERPSSTLVRDSDFFLSHPRDKLNISSFLFLSELNIYHLSFFIITHGAFNIADPSSTQDACHNELSKYDLACHESPSSSVTRVPDWCTGGHGFDSRRGLRFFLCPTLVTNWIFHLSYFYQSLTFTIFLSSLSNHTLYTTMYPSHLKNNIASQHGCSESCHVGFDINFRFFPINVVKWIFPDIGDIMRSII